MAVKFGSNRDAYRAGISGARSYPGSSGRGYKSSFQRGRRSGNKFRSNRKLNQTRNNYGRNTNKTFMTEAGDKLGNAIRSGGKKVKDMGIGAYAAMLRAGKELIMDPMMKASENKQIMGDLYKNKKSMDFIRDSVMTPENEAFYQKYKKLAGFASDNQERERLMGIANSARQNAQISSRINYGLGQLGYDTLGKEPFESYTTAMFGEANPRFNMKNFTAGIESTGIGKAFLAEADKAQAEESGKSMVGNAMKSFGSPRATFTTPAEMNREIKDYNNVVSSEDILPIPLPISNQPNMDDYNQIISPPFNATNTYPDLNFSYIRNKVFPGMNLEDITQEDLNNLSQQERFLLGYSG